VVREKYQRPEVKDLGTKWRMAYWDYSSKPRRKRSKVWGKQTAPSKREAQRLADQFMEKVNARNNEPSLYPSDDETLASLIAKCREKTWPHLKNSTRQHYEFFTEKYLLPTWGTMNPAIGVKLPRKKQRKPTILLPLASIGKLIELLPEPTKTVVVLIVFGSLRIGEVLALRWRHIHADRISVEERLYEGEFDDVKTDAGEREVPFDKRGLMKSVLTRRWNASKHRNPDDLVFSTRRGGALGRRNLLRHIKAAASKLGLSRAVDFRSFRTMHSSLMLREGARPEVVRDNMGHANIDVTQNVYGKSWWEERVEAVTRAVEAVSAATENEEKAEAKKDQAESVSNEWVPQQEAKIATC
jgi:integrase